MVFPSPAEVGLTGCAINNDPGVAWEPGFLKNRRGGVADAFAAGKSDDLVDESVWVAKKAVRGATVGAGQVLHVADTLPADSAE